VTDSRDLVITDVRKSFGPLEVLRGIDLCVPHGSFTALLGPSGSGKTTLLRILAGFERPDHGSVAVESVVFDDDDQHVRPEHRRVGYVSQDGSLFPHLTVGENVSFGLVRAHRHGARGPELLDVVGLSDLAHRYPHELSGGQQQRVALARALAVEPKIVLLDEPFAALDDQLRHGVRADVKRILADTGATAILVTHDQDEALSTADHVAVLRDGRVAQYASPEELYRHPADAELATLVGDANLVHGTIDGVEVETDFGRLVWRAEWPCRSGDDVTVLVRPEQLTVEPQFAGHDPHGTVAENRFHGHDLMVSIALNTGPSSGASAVARVLGQAALPIGTPVRLSVQGAVTVFAAPARRDQSPPS
jgi:iron(III) transport system ATP-binding protein